MAPKRKSRRTVSDSPETEVSPYEDISTRQRRMTGENFPNLPLGICDNCHWCYSCMNTRGIVKICPVCSEEVSLVPMRIDEVCVVDLDENGGITLEFTRKLPLR